MNDIALSLARESDLQARPRTSSIYANTLLALVQEVLAGRRSIASFCEAYSNYYVAHVPDVRMNSLQADFLMQVQQRIDWSDATVTPKAQTHGWQDHRALYTWLKQRAATYAIHNAQHRNIADF